MQNDISMILTEVKLDSVSAVLSLERNTLSKLFANSYHQELLSMLNHITEHIDGMALTLLKTNARFEELEISMKVQTVSEESARRFAGESVKSVHSVFGSPNIHETHIGDFYKKISDEKDAARKNFYNRIMDYNRVVRKLRRVRHNNVLVSWWLDKLGVPGWESLPKEIDVLSAYSSNDKINEKCIVTCAACRQKLRVPIRPMSGKATCPKCGSSFVIGKDG